MISNNIKMADWQHQRSSYINKNNYNKMNDKNNKTVLIVVVVIIIKLEIERGVM